MFEQYTLSVLRKFLREFNHGIKNYSKMNKATLVDEMEKHFIFSIQGGGNKNAGYVRRMEAENKIIFHKIHNPTKYMIDKYGVIVQEPEPQYEPEYEEAPPQAPLPRPIRATPPPPRAPQAPPKAPLPRSIRATPPQAPRAPPTRQIFAPDQVLDFNVAREKPKKKRTKTPTEVEEEREQQRLAEEQQKEIEQRETLLDSYESLRLKLIERRDKQFKLNNDHRASLTALKSKKGLRKQKKYLMEDKIHEDYYTKTKSLNGEYPEVIKYIKTNKLKNDFNSIYTDIRKRMSKV